MKEDDMNMACHRCHAPTPNDELSVLLMPVEDPEDSAFLGTTLCTGCRENLRIWLWEAPAAARRRGDLQ